MKIKFIALLALVGLPSIAAQAQVTRGESNVALLKKQPEANAATALESLKLARNQTQKEIVKLVSMTGTGGSPNPGTWSMVFHDPASSSYLSILRPGSAPKPARQQYTEGETPNYFDASRVNHDSPAAFQVANKEAAAAKVGFDRVNYELRGREFTGEPVWTLRLINTDNDLVGIIHLSAESGKLLRSVWLRRTARSTVRVIDSALSSGGPSAAAESAGASTDKELKALPPVQNIEPPPAPKP